MPPLTMSAMRIGRMSARLVVLLFVLQTAAYAQWLDYPTPGIPRTKDGKPDLAAPAPKARDGKPDLGGIWQIVNPARVAARRAKEIVGPNLLDFMPEGTQIPFKSAAAALYKQRSESLGKGRPSSLCLPHGVPDAMLLSHFKLAQMPGLTLILFEEFNHYRQILTDGRKLPTDIPPAWFGYSIGRWDGNAFIAETAGFNDKSWLDDYGMPHTEALHTTERFERPDFGHLNVQITFDDAEAYTKPWSVTLHFQLLPDTEFLEDICDNERDAQHAVGR
jgi:hypothetical protein